MGSQEVSGSCFLADVVLLQILLRLGAAFQARDYMSCIKRLPSGGADAAPSDGSMLSELLLAE
jgi:hypothetical protein